MTKRDETLIQPVVLCGGHGTRLWPRSRPDAPKPFLPLVGSNTLFEATLERCADAARFAPPMIVAGAQHTRHVRDQSAGSAGAQLIVEPEGRNTAPAIALAAHALDPDAIMLVCPSDHHIADSDAFRGAAIRACALAAQGWLTSIAITATRPETGYGYLKRGDPVGEGHRTAQFVEKPDLERAQSFLDAGDYAWNAGIFALRAGTLLDELQAHRPDMAAALAGAVQDGEWRDGEFHPGASHFASIAGESIDYAVMENTGRAAMVSADMGWSDIGNWAALHEASDRDDAGNTAPETADLRDCSNVYVSSDGPRVSVIGAQDLIVVVDGDEVLVTTHDGAQAVGKLPGAGGK